MCEHFRKNLCTDYRYRFTPAELHYMYGKPRHQKPKPKPEQAAQTNQIQDLVKKLRNKVQKIVHFFTINIT